MGVDEHGRCDRQLGSSVLGACLISSRDTARANHLLPRRHLSPLFLRWRHAFEPKPHSAMLVRSTNPKVDGANLII